MQGLNLPECVRDYSAMARECWSVMMRLQESPPGDRWIEEAAEAIARRITFPRSPMDLVTHEGPPDTLAIAACVFSRGCKFNRATEGVPSDQVMAAIQMERAFVEKWFVTNMIPRPWRVCRISVVEHSTAHGCILLAFDTMVSQLHRTFALTFHNGSPRSDVLHDERMLTYWRTILRDLQKVGQRQAAEAVEAMKIAEAAPRPRVANESRSNTKPPTHNKDFTEVAWSGMVFKFSGLQAKAVELLWREAQQGFGLHQATIGEKIGSGNEAFRLAHLFRKHPAWGCLIKMAGKGTYRVDLTSSNGIHQ